MSNYEDDQSEDGELARSPVQDEMDFRYIRMLNNFYREEITYWLSSCLYNC